MNKSYDAIIIGTGQAGPFLAIKMAKAGRKVAIIERGRLAGPVSTPAASRRKPWWPARARPTWQDARRSSASTPARCRST